MISLGSDPEMFFVSPETGAVPAGYVFDKLGLEHKHTHMFFGNLYVDGFSLELQPEPGTPEMVVEYFMALQEQGQRYADELGLTIKIIPEIQIDIAWTKKQKETAIFGCDPDKSAWGEACKPASINAAIHPMRYAGGHIHVGMVGSPRHFDKNIEEVIKALDRTVGLFSHFIANGRDNHRRQIYGRPGIYRYQPHGLEYRTPSNTIMETPEKFLHALNVAEATVEAFDAGFEFREILPDELVYQALYANDCSATKTLYQRVIAALGVPTWRD